MLLLQVSSKKEQMSNLGKAMHKFGRFCMISDNDTRNKLNPD